MTSELARALGLVSVTMVVLSACGGADDVDDDTDVAETDAADTDPSDTDDTDTPDPTLARVRVVHASPNAPSVSLWSGGAKLVDALAYGEATGFVELPPGAYTVDLCLAGASACATPAFSVDLTVGEGDVVTAVAAGDFGATDAATRFRVLPLVHGFADPGAGNLSARLVHASADAPTVGLDVGKDDASTPEVPSFARWSDTGAAGVALPAGASLRVGVVAGGDHVTSFTLPALPAGGEWFVVATGFLGAKSYADDGFSLLAVSAASDAVWLRQDPRVFVLHGSPDAPSVDLFVGGAQIVGDLAFGEYQGVQVSPGTYAVDIFGASAGSARPAGDPAASTSLTVAGGQEVLAFATGFLGSTAAADRFRVVAVPAAFAQDVDDAAQVQLFHGSPDTPAVDVGPHAGFTLSSAVFADVAFGGASGIVELPAGTYDLGAALPGSTAAVAAFDGVPLDGTEQAWAIAAGSLGGNGPGLRVFLVDTRPAGWSLATVEATFPTL